MSNAANKSAGRRTALKLVLIPILMFGFGYALVPLYNVFCDLTGLGGRSIKQIEESQFNAAGVDEGRNIKIEFITSINGDLPWRFKPLTRTKTVHPGALSEARFSVENQSDQTIVGRAVYNVTPSQASLYLSKTECFCYTEQTLQPGEKLEMPVRFVIDTDLPANIKGVTLSYTFFATSHPAAKKTAGNDADGSGIRPASDRS